MLELVTVIVAAHLASPWGIPVAVLLHTVLGAALVAASAGAFNQWWEQVDRCPHDAHRQSSASRRPAYRAASHYVSAPPRCSSALHRIEHRSERR